MADRKLTQREADEWAKKWAAQVLFGFIDCDTVLDGDDDEDDEDDHSESNMEKRSRAVAKLIKRLDPGFRHRALGDVDDAEVL